MSEAVAERLKRLGEDFFELMAKAKGSNQRGEIVHAYRVVRSEVKKENNYVV